MAALKLEDIPAEARSGFMKLQSQFRRGLPARFAQIEAASTTDARVEALHRLSGAAGSYGYEELGAVARRAMALSEAGGRPEALTDCLQTLNSCISATLQEAGD